MSIFKRKQRTERSCLADSAGYYHFRDDCPSISGKTKQVYGSSFLKYRLCPTCDRQHSTVIRENASDMQENEGKYMTEFLDNVGKLDKTDSEKIDIAKRGLLAIRLQTFFWSALDDMQKGTRR